MGRLLSFQKKQAEFTWCMTQHSLCIIQAVTEMPAAALRVWETACLQLPNLLFFCFSHLKCTSVTAAACVHRKPFFPCGSPCLSAILTELLIASYQKQWHNPLCLRTKGLIFRGENFLWCFIKPCGAHFFKLQIFIYTSNCSDGSVHTGNVFVHTSGPVQYVSAAATIFLLKNELSCWDSKVWKHKTKTKKRIQTCV